MWLAVGLDSDSIAVAIERSRAKSLKTWVSTSSVVWRATSSKYIVRLRSKVRSIWFTYKKIPVDNTAVQSKIIAEIFLKESDSVISVPYTQKRAAKDAALLLYHFSRWILSGSKRSISGFCSFG